ncbi:Hypothetical predicted protein, partial [Drosophila guanche]
YHVPPTANASAHHQYYRHQKQQNQQQQQLQQSCVRQQQRQLQWEQQLQSQLANSSSEFDEFHWPIKQPQQGGTTGGGGKIYITPADIPPPPHPPQQSGNSHHNDNKSRQHHSHPRAHQPQHGPLTTPAHRTPPHRCKCEHPNNELMDCEEAVIARATATNTSANVNMHRHQHPPYYYKAGTSARRHSGKLHESMLVGGSSLDDDDLASIGNGMSRFK